MPSRTLPLSRILAAFVALAALCALAAPVIAAPRLGFYTTPAYPIVDQAFDVHVASVDDPNAAPVTNATTVVLTAASGTGALGGSTSCTIPAGGYTCTIAGATYPVRETFSATLSVASGDARPAHTGNIDVEGRSATVEVEPQGPTPQGAPVTLVARVTGDAPTGTVRFSRNDVELCAAAPLSGTGGTRSASCTTASLPVGTVSIGAAYSGDAKHNPATSVPVAHVVFRSATNVALAANGGVATASSTIAVAGYSFPVASVVDGSHSGAWSSGGGWNDATSGAFPDWVQVRFNGSKTIDKVVVTTLQDNYTSPVEPGDSTTFSQYGITSFQVQTWNGTSWVTRATVSGNNRVKRTVSIPATTTDRIRINVTGALASYSRIVEIEAWTAAPATATTVSLTSTTNPTVYTEPVTLIASVTGDSPTGRVQLTENGVWQADGAIVNGKATLTLPAVSPGEHEYVAEYHGDARNIGSVSATHVHVVVTETGAVNVAAGGGVATASSTYIASGTDFGVASVIDGIRTAMQWGRGHGGGWNDATADRFPDWVQIDFGGRKTIDSAVVFTLQDEFERGIAPTDVETFTRWGVTAFQVQTWNGTAWTTQAAVSGNNLVRRKVTFPPVTTDRMRVLVTGALASYSRLVEIEAWSSTPVSTTTTLTSSANPMATNQSVTFTASVTNVTSNGHVDFRGGSADYLCINVPLVGGRAQCTVTWPVAGGFPVWAVYGGAPGTSGSSSELLYQVVMDAPPATNVALAANGGVATASSTIVVAGYSFPVASVVDGSHSGAWSSGGGWNDATSGAFPDWVQVRFNGSKTIDKVVVTTLQDNYTSPVEPGDSTTFSQYGITSFQVQTWNGTSWVTRATVSGNNRVKRTVSIPATTTDRIRINVTGALASYSRIVEIEAWTASIAGKAMTSDALEVARGAPEPTEAAGGPAVPAATKVDSDATPVPVLSPTAMALLVLTVGLAGLAARRRRVPERRRRS